MGRKVRIRVSLAADVTYLSRLMNAIEADESRPIEWRTRVVGNLQSLIGLLVGPLAKSE